MRTNAKLITCRGKLPSSTANDTKTSTTQSSNSAISPVTQPKNAIMLCSMGVSSGTGEYSPRSASIQQQYPPTWWFNATQLIRREQALKKGKNRRTSLQMGQYTSNVHNNNTTKTHPPNHHDANAWCEGNNPHLTKPRNHSVPHVASRQQKLHLPLRIKTEPNESPRANTQSRWSWR